MLNCLKQVECKVAGNVALHSFGLLEDAGTVLTVAVKCMDEALANLRGDYDIFRREPSQVYISFPGSSEELLIVEVGDLFKSLKTKKRIMPTSMCNVIEVVTPESLAHLAVCTVEKKFGSSESLSLLKVYINK